MYCRTSVLNSDILCHSVFFSSIHNFYESFFYFSLANDGKLLEQIPKVKTLRNDKREGKVILTKEPQYYVKMNDQVFINKHFHFSLI